MYLSRSREELSKCRLCCRNHSLQVCKAFLAMSPTDRLESARVHHYCLNCLATSHATGSCDSRGSCRRCGLAHHTLLHRISSPPSRRKRSDDIRSRLQHRVVRKPIATPSRRIDRSKLIRKLMVKAINTLKTLKELMRLTSPQARRRVADMDLD